MSSPDLLEEWIQDLTDEMNDIEYSKEQRELFKKRRTVLEELQQWQNGAKRLGDMLNQLGKEKN